jgi:predicted DNA-binding transcriptional regulator AlpA
MNSTPAVPAPPTDAPRVDIVPSFLPGDAVPPTVPAADEDKRLTMLVEELKVLNVRFEQFTELVYGLLQAILNEKQQPTRYPTANRWLKLDEVALHLGISKGRVRKLHLDRKQSRFPSHVQGKLIRVRLNDLDEWFKYEITPSYKGSRQRGQ